MKAVRKYVRDANGRFAKVAGNDPKGTLFHMFSPADQNLITKQEKADRAKARREKAKLLAAANKTAAPAPEKPQPAPKLATPKDGSHVTGQPKPPPSQFMGAKSTEVIDAENELIAAKNAGDPAAAKKARAKLRRAKAKQEAANAGQKVTFPEEVKQAEPAPTSAKSKRQPKVAPSETETKAQADVAEGTKRANELTTQINAKSKEIKDLRYGFAEPHLTSSQRWKKIQALEAERDQLRAKRAQISSQVMAARQTLQAEREKRLGKVDNSETGAAKKELAAIRLRESENNAAVQKITAEIVSLEKEWNYTKNQDRLTELYKQRTPLIAESVSIKKQRVEAQAKLDRLTGKLDTNADVTNLDWTNTRKMNTSISAMNALYEKDDPDFRKKVSTPWDSGAGQEISGKLPADVRKAHTDYTHATYRYINGALRDGKVDSTKKVGSDYIDNYWSKRGGMRPLVDNVSKLINGEGGHTTQEPVTVMRGVRGNASYHPEEIYIEGAIVEEKAFTSVTVSKAIQRSFAKPRGFKGDNSSWSMYIRLPAGTNYAHGNLVEREMILDHGTKFKVLKVDKVKNEIYLAKVD